MILYMIFNIYLDNNNSNSYFLVLLDYLYTNQIV